MRFNCKEDIIALTPQWKGERFPDVRPNVQDRYLDELYKMTLEELWKPIFVQGYENQCSGGLNTLHPEFTAYRTFHCTLIGRAVSSV